MEGEQHARLEVAIVPSADAIRVAQRVVDDLSSSMSKDEDIGWRLAMAAHELLDNARKYGVEDIASLRFSLDVGGAAPIANVHVRSRGMAARIADLRSIVAEISDASDPWAFYVDAMRKSGTSASRASASRGSRPRAACTSR